MTDCQHKNIVLLSKTSKKVRCIHCHLVIKEDELDDDYCPECYDEKGKRLSDFEPVKEKAAGDKYRCEDCGVVIGELQDDQQNQ